MELTREQAKAAATAERMLSAGEREVRIGGLAGTGKTQIASALPHALGLRSSQVAYCAYTVKAAHVLNRRLGSTAATTIHRLIYRPTEHHRATCPCSRDSRASCHAPGGTCPRCFMRFERVRALDGRLQLLVVDARCNWIVAGPRFDLTLEDVAGVLECFERDDDQSHDAVGIQRVAVEARNRRSPG